MAAQSPVVLDSSSPPPAFRHPSITPQKSGEASSSPGLPEVSSFFKADGKAPAAASRATTTLPGFTSAGTLWKAAAVEEERKERMKEGVSNVPTKKSTGKLVQPVRKVQAVEKAASPGRDRSRTPSISEFEFKSEENHGEMHPPQVVKKVVKRVAKPKAGDGSVKVKKAADRAKDSSDALANVSKRSAASTSMGQTSEEAEKSTKSQVQFSVLDSSIVERTADMSVHGQSRKSSIAFSEYGYNFKEPLPSKTIDQASAYFSASNAICSPKASGANLAEKVPEKLPEVQAAASQSPFSPEKPNLMNETCIPPVPALPAEPDFKASICVSEFDHRPAGQSVITEPPTPKLETVIKQRKRTTDAKSTTSGGQAKKPKKRFAKSESIILNSDEPDPVAQDVPDAGREQRPSVEEIQTAVHAPTKAKKPSKTSKAAENKRPSKAAEVELPEGPGFGIWSQSAYFNHAPVAKTIEMDATAESLQTVFALNGDLREAPANRPDPPAVQTDMPPSPHLHTSFPRRRSWTPAKNTYDILDPEVDSSGESPAPRKSLADLVGGFGYDGQAQSRTRSPAGEPLTKRRRIEPGEEGAAMPVPRKVAAAKEKVKRVKAPKKKPQTITDLATKAYRVEEAEVHNAQSTVSEFFTAQKDGHAAATLPTATNEAPPTFKKPRKPRAKKVDGEASTSKKTPKPKKVKVKFNEAARLPSLLSPQEARAEEKKQGFLFGTSSQLALEEDVSFVRDLQIAIQQSESVDETIGCQRRLSTKVSVGQTDRGLFWCGSRDAWGHVTAPNGVRRKGVVTLPQGAVAAPESSRALATAAALTGQSHTDVLETVVSRQDSLEHVDVAPEETEDSQVVDLCATSPVSAAQDGEGGFDPADALLPSDQPGMQVDAMAPDLPTQMADDSWMLLESDSSDDDEFSVPTLAKTAPVQPISTGPAINLLAAHFPRAATSPLRNQTQSRPALTALDSNIAMLAQTSPAKQHRPFATQASPDSLKGLTERLPRVHTSTSAAALSPKRRGQPSKSVSPQKTFAPEQPAFSASQPPLSSDFVAIDDISDSGSEDNRPLKDVVSVRAAPTSPKRRGRPPKASQQSPITSPSKSSFVNIDDISDSDAGKQTPSPRRWKKGVASPVQTLELSPSASTDVGLAPILDGKAAMKPTDVCWTLVSKGLFTQITAVVKSTAPCGENGALSWWEKILMYDPIVLEDLTAWLVGQGVSIVVRRKTVKKKRKKRKGEVEEEFEEYEAVKEELKGWMVQKWCEEKSICCLWREGLRGGVKVRY